MYTIVYFILILITLFSWWIGKQNESDLYLAWSLLFLAAFKVYLIGDYFMGLKQISGFWRWVIIVWVILVSLPIALAFYYASPAYLA